jgi:hypothetical protein
MASGVILMTPPAADSQICYMSSFGFVTTSTPSVTNQIVRRREQDLKAKQEGELSSVPGAQVNVDQEESRWSGGLVLSTGTCSHDVSHVKVGRLVETLRMSKKEQHSVGRRGKQSQRNLAGPNEQ